MVEVMKDRILQKEEFIQQFVLKRITHCVCGKTCVKEALAAWKAIREECDLCNCP